MKRFIPGALLSALLAAVCAPAPAAPAAPPYKVDVGVIRGAQFAVASPATPWNHCVLLLAHGYRPESAPLIADLHPERDPARTFLGEGWMVATTSYRRNGIIVADAISDLDALRGYIAKAYGEPEKVILAGESVGGLIVTIMSERDTGPYQGAVAFDATLYVKETNSNAGLTLLPRIPLLFVVTPREAAQARSYLSAVARPDPIVQPAMFTVSRAGHDNFNPAERVAAIRAMDAWIERGPGALPKPAQDQHFYDVTVAPDPGPSTAVIHAEQHSLETRVAQVDPVYGSVLLEAQASDFESAGIPVMTFFELRAGGKAYRALYGRSYADVKNGEWVAFPDADGRTVLSLTFANAAQAAGLKAGDDVSLAGVSPRPAPSP